MILINDRNFNSWHIFKCVIPSVYLLFHVPFHFIVFLLLFCVCFFVIKWIAFQTSNLDLVLIFFFRSVTCLNTTTTRSPVFTLGVCVCACARALMRMCVCVCICVWHGTFLFFRKYVLHGHDHQHDIVTLTSIFRGRLHILCQWLALILYWDLWNCSAWSHLWIFAFTVLFWVSITFSHNVLLVYSIINEVMYCNFCVILFFQFTSLLHNLLALMNKAFELSNPRSLGLIVPFKTTLKIQPF